MVVKLSKKLKNNDVDKIVMATNILKMQKRYLKSDDRKVRKYAICHTRLLRPNL